MIRSNNPPNCVRQASGISRSAKTSDGSTDGIWNKQYLQCHCYDPHWCTNKWPSITSPWAIAIWVLNTPFINAGRPITKLSTTGYLATAAPEGEKQLFGTQGCKNTGWEDGMDSICVKSWQSSLTAGPEALPESTSICRISRTLHSLNLNSSIIHFWI